MSDEVTVGIYFPNTGSASSVAVSLQENVLWAIDYFNAQGRFPKIRPLVSRKPSQKEAIEDLANRGALVIFGGATSAQAGELLVHCRSRNIPLISPVSSLSDMAVAGDLLYRGLHDSYGPGKLAGDIAREEGISGYLTFTVDDNSGYGGSFANGFSDGAGMETLQNHVVNGSLSSHSISRIIDENRPFDTAVMILPDRWSCRVTQQLKLFFPGIRIWIADWGSSPALARVGGPAMEGVRQTGYFPVDLHDMNHPFISSVNRIYGTDWDPFSLDLSYRAVALFVTALEERESSADGIRTALEKVTRIDGLYGPLEVNEMGDVVAPLRVAHIEKGEWKSGNGENSP